jgi:hypothetical protein
MTTTSSISLYGASTIGGDFGGAEGFNGDALWRFVIFLLMCMGWNLQYQNLQLGCWFSFPLLGSSLFGWSWPSKLLASGLLFQGKNMAIGRDAVLGRSMDQQCIACVDVLLIKELQKFVAASSEGPASSFMRRVPPETRKKAGRTLGELKCNFGFFQGFFCKGKDVIIMLILL